MVHEIIKILGKNKIVTVQQITNQFNISEDFLKATLKYLESANIIQYSFNSKGGCKKISICGQCPQNRTIEFWETKNERRS